MAVLPLRSSRLRTLMLAPPWIGSHHSTSNKPGGAHAAADAHRDDDVLDAAALAFDERVADEPRARHAVGMADRDGAAVDIVFVRDRCRAGRGNRAPGRRTPRSTPTSRCRRSRGHAAAGASAPRRSDRCPSPPARCRRPSCRGRGRAARDRAAAASFASISTHADAPSESWLALPAVTVPPSITGASAARLAAVVSGRLPSSFASVTSLYETSFVALSTTAIVAVIGTISAAKRPSACAARRALLRRKRIGVLRVAADLVLARDILGGQQHRHVRVLDLPGHVRVLLRADPFEIALLDGGDVVLAAGDDDLHAVDDDLLRGRGDRRQPGRALAIDRLRAGRDRNARGERRIARDVHSGGAGGQHRADDDVLDLGAVDAARARTAWRIACAISVGDLMLLSAPRNARPIGVRAVETMTASLMAVLLSNESLLSAHALDYRR